MADTPTVTQLAWIDRLDQSVAVLYAKVRRDCKRARGCRQENKPLPDGFKGRFHARLSDIKGRVNALRRLVEMVSPWWVASDRKSDFALTHGTAIKGVITLAGRMVECAGE